VIEVDVENKCKTALEVAKEFCLISSGAIPKGYELRTKKVTVTRVYRSGIGSYNFDIPDAEAPYDQYLEDKIGAIGVDITEFITTLAINDYSGEEIEEIVDELDAKSELERVTLPRPIKLTVEYFVAR